MNYSYRKLLIPFLWVAYIVISFRVFARIPSGPIMEILFVIVFLFLIYVFSKTIIYDLMSTGRLNYLFLVLLPLLIYPIITAYQAQKNFGQPILYGILAQRQHYLCLGCFFLVYALKKNLISLGKLQKYYGYAMIFILIVMLFFYLFIDPRIFSSTEFVKLTYTKGWKYDFPEGVVAGLTFYAVIKIWLERKPSWYFFLLLALFFFIVFAQDRSQLLAIVLIVMLIFVRHLNLKRKIVYGIYGLYGLLLLIVVIALMRPDIFEHYITMYQSIYELFTGGNTTESSSAIRIVESGIALRGFAKHAWLGNGFVSSQWHDGFSGIYGYFYPADVGILGNLFIYGIVGTIIFYVPIILSLIWAWRMRKIRDTFYLTCFYTMIFTFLDMFSAASNIKYVGIMMFYFGMLYYFRYFYNPNENIDTA